MDIRRSFDQLSDSEVEALVEAFIKLKAEIVNPTAPEKEQYSTYDKYVAMHVAVMNISVNGAPPFNYGHSNIAFLPWHREFIRRLEKDLQRVKPGVTLPYWDWSLINETRTKLFSKKFMGDLPKVPAPIEIKEGYFRKNGPENKPDWWPEGFNGWVIANGLIDGAGTKYLRRGESGAESAWPAKKEILDEVTKINYSLPNINDYYFLWIAVEFGSYYKLEGGELNQTSIAAHNTGHRWVGGDMATAASPNDPIFFLHHCYIDKLWAKWQDNGHEGEAFYPDSETSPLGSDNPKGTLLNDRMWPWIGSASGYTTGASDAIKKMIPDYSGEPEVLIKSVLDYKSMGYQYED